MLKILNVRIFSEYPQNIHIQLNYHRRLTGLQEHALEFEFDGHLSKVSCQRKVNNMDSEERQ